MHFANTEHYSKAGKYAAICDQMLFLPFLFDTLIKDISDPKVLQELEAARTDAMTEWERAKAITDPGESRNATAALFQEVWSWANDFHLQFIAGLCLLKIGEASDEQMFHFFAIATNSVMHGSLGMQITTEAVLTLLHWRVFGRYHNHAALKMSVTPSKLQDALGMLANKVLNDYKDTDVRKKWATLARLWIDTPVTKNISVGQFSDDLTLYLSAALLLKDKEALNMILATRDLDSEIRSVVTKELIRLGEPPQEAFGNLDEKSFKELLSDAGKSKSPKVLRQIFNESETHNELIWNWLRNVSNDQWQDENLRAALREGLSGKFLVGFNKEKLGDFFVWVSEVLADKTDPLTVATELSTVIDLWDQQVNDMPAKYKVELAESRAMLFRVALSKLEDLNKVIDLFALKMTQPVINNLSGWDNFTERMQWNSKIKEGHLVAALTTSFETAFIVKDKWSLHDDEAPIKLIWSQIADGHPNSPFLVAALSRSHKNIPALQAAIKRECRGKDLAAVIGDREQWVSAVAKFYCLYDSVDFLNWLPAAPESWNSYYRTFCETYHGGKPELGNINAWVKFAQKLKVNIDQNPEQWMIFLRTFLRDWGVVVDGAKGTVDDHYLTSSDQELAKALSGDSSRTLCLLAG